MKKIMVLAMTLCAFSFTIAATDNATLHNMLVKFYGYQRAGLKTGSCNNLNSGFTDASHGGDNYNGNPLDGGWYDAGDYIKFGMNLSYSVYCLLKGYDVFPSGYDDKYDGNNKTGADGIPDILNQVKFATDYICKAVIDDKTVILDVGNAASEHNTWGVANASGRTGTLCDAGDIPATYAACLALMSTLYAKYDQKYSDQCLEKAKQAFAFAKSKFDANKNYCTPQTKAGKALYDYPVTDGEVQRQFADRMVAAGVELYRATKNGDPIYRTWAKKTIIDYYNCIGYVYIGPLAAFEVWRQGLPGGASALSTNITFLKSKMKTTGTFKNVYQNSGWGTARDIGSAAFEFALGYVTSSNEASREDYLQKVKDHVDWLTGASGGKSFICGVNGGPQKIHYRTTNYGAVPGAVVSGPDGDGNWQDNGDANFCEVAVDYNAGITGAVAFLRAIENPGENVAKVSKAFTATPNTDVDFNSTTVNFSCTFAKTVTCTITVNGEFGTKTIASSGTAISAKWDGSADKGFFLGGEIVKANIKIDSDIAAFDLLNVAPVSVTIASTKKSPSKPGDTLIDNFEDGDTLNQIGGVWQAFGTGTGLKATRLSFAAQDSSMALLMSGNVTTPDNATFSGVKTTFNPAGTAVSLGTPTSIIFSAKSTVSTKVYCELEQSTITDGAYHSVVFPVSTVQNTYRLDFSEFAQPDWKTAGVPLDLNSITALRFTVYDSTGLAKLYFDDIAIENLGVSNTMIRPRQLKSTAFSPFIANGCYAFSLLQQINEPLVFTIHDISGRIVQRKAITTAGQTMTIQLPKLPTGLYFTTVHSINGTSGNQFRQQGTFTIVK